MPTFEVCQNNHFTVNQFPRYYSALKLCIGMDPGSLYLPVSNTDCYIPLALERMDFTVSEKEQS